MSVVKLEAPDLEEGVAPLSPIILTSPIPHRRRRVRVRVPRTVRRIVGPLIVLILWQVVCSAGVFTSFEVASPSRSLTLVASSPSRAYYYQTC